jgi:hypothetical protein
MILCSYADDNMTISQTRLWFTFSDYCGEGLQRRGIDCRHVVSGPSMFGPFGYAHGFYVKNKAILDQPRGAGYWLWKPFIINDALKRWKDGEWVVYCDAGIELRGDITPLFDLGQDIVLFNNEWAHVDWCKRDVLQAMVGNWWDPGKQQAQASVICVRRTAFTARFIAEWLDWCQKPGFIDDSPSAVPNHPGFREHRHDQAILTNLAIRYDIPMHWWPAHYNTPNKHKYAGDTYPVLFYHHRFRNNEWPEEEQAKERKRKAG